ncbi:MULTISPECIES: metallophosphoesterase family protein [unclassified Nocardioides]|uniref:metallophosphoesterase family protein n=1 Tax=unclassified Nocardioides TaxID=2615069 RepID=UPI003014CF1D
MSSLARRVAQVLVAWLAYGLAAALVALPVSVVWALQHASFEDSLGAFPVEVSLAHDGRSTVDTGVLGKIYWERTGAGGFGADIRSTGPPEAGGTLSSYVSPAFLRVNAAFVDDPAAVAEVYGAELRDQVVDGLLRLELAIGVVVGGLLTAAFRGGAPPYPRRRGSWRWRAGLTAGVLATGLGISTVVALQAFHAWSARDDEAETYPMPGVDGVSFSSPQTVEVAQQVQPFIEKNQTRIEENARAYTDAVAASFDTELPLHAADLTPRDGEKVVVAEADPQGSLVGTRARKAMYPRLAEALGEDALTVRTISGDISSNGTVAEKGFVKGEAGASPDIPTVAVKGDHDSDTTVEQLRDNDVQVPDLETVDVDGLTIAGAADPAFKALFGGLVTNESGLEERDLGVELRELVDGLDDSPAVIALLHQPRAVSGYLGITGTSELADTIGQETVPWDDGIDDVPPGLVDFGHLHDVAGPWVVWNTGEEGDADHEVTWTVVSQLGTSGGVLEAPTFNRFSTPFSVPLKTVSLQLQYVDGESGLQTGYAPIDVSVDGTVTIGDRVEVGLPGGQPLTRGDLGLD